ncbi:MAG: pilus assembly protein [Verrucomicrobia bacterium]|nr:pilus assembly protein [Verrucomicrobiota bacterium]
MKRKANSLFEELNSDECGAAMTEFAITCPVILFFFLVMLQFLQIVRASQHVNYAAYAAARAYSVHESVDGKNGAQDAAEEAAAIALAPVARLLPKELPLIGGIRIPENLPGFAQQSGDFVMGYLAAKLRLDDTYGLGGSVKISLSGNPRQVDVLINYPQPIFIPGLVELWAYIRPGDSAFGSMKPLHKGLQGIPGKLLPIAETWESLQTPHDNAILAPGSVPTFIFPYINVTAKCSIGHSDWGHKNPEYRPRIRNTVEDADTDDTDMNRMSDAQGSGEAMKQHAEDMKSEQGTCADWRSTQQDLVAAQENFNQVDANPNASVSQRQIARQQLDAAANSERAARAQYQGAHNQRISSQQNVEHMTGKKVSYEFDCR